MTKENDDVLETVIIFDWDDTLLPSSYLSWKGLKLDSDEKLIHENGLYEQLQEFQEDVIKVLKMAMTCGEVHIVTNAETGWVQLSAQKFVPGVVSLLPHLKVFSARSTYEHLYPEEPKQWKYHAFLHKLSGVISRPYANKNIISFGDSHVEREAIRAVTRTIPNARTKSVKFAERPTIEQLRRQIELVTNCFQYIHQHSGDLDLQLNISLKPQEQDEKDNTETTSEKTEHEEKSKTKKLEHKETKIKEQSCKPQCKSHDEPKLVVQQQSEEETKTKELAEQRIKLADENPWKKQRQQAAI